MSVTSRLRCSTPLLAAALIVAGCGSAGDSDDDDGQPALVDEPEAGGAAIDETDVDSPATEPTLSLWPTPFADSSVVGWRVEILERLDHDSGAFTQGLEVVDGTGYESTGRYGESTIRRFDPVSGAVLASVDLDDGFFGEGLTVVDDTIIQLTWREGRALRYDAATLESLPSLGYEGEGWGLCDLGDTLVMSDGTPRIRLVDAVDFSERASVEVRLDDQPVDDLNELECVDDLVIANVWGSPNLVVFDPTTGSVRAEIDASALTAEMADTVTADPQNVLNGVAALDDHTLLLSGKRWPTTFRVRLIDG